MTRLGLLALYAIIALAWTAGAQEPIPLADCAMCHEDEAAAFVAGPHGRAMATVGEDVLSRSCVTCHGPATEHIDDPTADNIRRTPGRDACITCHQGRRSLTDLSTPGHIRHGVACLDCHQSGHLDGEADHLLASAPHELCGSCHLSEAGAFQLPFAHRDGTRPFECTNCHSVHGDNRQGRLAVARTGGVCVDCHSEKAGPFVFPHPPRAIDGCVSCHSPHGSTNPRLLNRSRMAALCLECHAGVPAFHDISRPRYQSCQNCHAAIHGSNRDPRLIEE